jgi:hypothetical protein
VFVVLDGGSQDARLFSWFRRVVGIGSTCFDVNEIREDLIVVDSLICATN